MLIFIDFSLGQGHIYLLLRRFLYFYDDVSLAVDFSLFILPDVY